MRVRDAAIGEIYDMRARLRIAVDENESGDECWIDRRYHPGPTGMPWALTSRNLPVPLGMTLWMRGAQSTNTLLSLALEFNVTHDSLPI
jgi:hypothetical protein